MQALANASGLVIQAEVYHKTPVEVSYSVRPRRAGDPIVAFANHIIALISQCGTRGWASHLVPFVEAIRSLRSDLLVDDINPLYKYMVRIHDQIDPV